MSCVLPLSSNPTKKICPRCGMGNDTDGDGNCAICARLTDDEVGRMLSAPYPFADREAARSSTSVTTFTSTRDKGRSI